MYKWCLDNQITLNIKKCEYVHFSYRKQINPSYELKLGEIVLNNVKQYKYLGSVVDDKLTEEPQDNNILKVWSHRKQTFSKIRFLLDQKTAELLFKSIQFNQFVTTMIFTIITAQNRPLCEKQDRCSLFSVLFSILCKGITHATAY